MTPEQEIKQLEQTIENDKVTYETLKLHDQEEICMLNSKVAELEQQIEKMKCCSNCKHFNKEDDLECCQNCERQLVNSLDNLKAEEIIKDEWEIEK